jgi:hypothetical protein
VQLREAAQVLALARTRDDPVPNPGVSSVKVAENRRIEKRLISIRKDASVA